MKKSKKSGKTTAGVKIEKKSRSCGFALRKKSGKTNGVKIQVKVVV